MFSKNSNKHFNEIFSNFSEIFGETYSNFNLSKDSHITSEDSGWSIEIAVPGFLKDEISIKVDNQVLTVEGKVKENEESKIKRDFKKTYSIPNNIKLDKVDASLENGILFIKLEKSKSEDFYEVKIK
jgi:HSP20 family protein